MRVIRTVSTGPNPYDQTYILEPHEGCSGCGDAIAIEFHKGIWTISGSNPIYTDDDCRSGPARIFKLWQLEIEAIDEMLAIADYVVDFAEEWTIDHNTEPIDEVALLSIFADAAADEAVWQHDYQADDAADYAVAQAQIEWWGSHDDPAEAAYTAMQYAIDHGYSRREWDDEGEADYAVDALAEDAAAVDDLANAATVITEGVQRQLKGDQECG